MNYYLQLQEMYIDTITDYLDILPSQGMPSFQNLVHAFLDPLHW